MQVSSPPRREGADCRTGAVSPILRRRSDSEDANDVTRMKHFLFMKRFFSAHAACLFLVLCACRGENLAPTQDLGGNLHAYVADVRRLDASGAAKAIRGVCASACTIYLGARKVCVEPDAQLWFHAAHLPGDTDPDPIGSLEMLSYYPTRVRDWAIRQKALETTELDGARMLDGESLIRMGVPRCPAAGSSQN
jgi:hypothetical protein